MFVRDQPLKPCQDSKLGSSELGGRPGRPSQLKSWGPLLQPQSLLFAACCCLLLLLLVLRLLLLASGACWCCWCRSWLWCRGCRWGGVGCCAGVAVVVAAVSVVIRMVCLKCHCMASGWHAEPCLLRFEVRVQGLGFWVCSVLWASFFMMLEFGESTSSHSSLLNIGITGALFS